MFKNKNKVSVDMNCLIETLNKIENRLLEISGIIFYEKRLIRNFEDVKMEMHDLKEQGIRYNSRKI